MCKLSGSVVPLVLAGALWAVHICAPAEDTAPVKQAAGWRSDGSGCFPGADPVLEWSLNPRKNIKWATVVGPSHSSPIVAGDRVFVTVEPDRLLCLNKADGRILWTRAVSFDDLPPAVAAGLDDDKREPTTQAGYATPSPVADGQHVFVFLGTGLTACYDYDGKRMWTVFLDYPQLSSEGRATSLVIAGGKLLVQPGCLVALAPKTGQTLWVTPKGAIKCTHGTAAAATIGGVEVVITAAGDVVRLADGKILAQKLGRLMYPSPVVKDGVVYLISNLACAVALPDKAADQMNTADFAERWSAKFQGVFYASPVCHDGLVYTIARDASYIVLDAATGAVVQQKVLDLPPAGSKAEKPSVYPSVTLAGKHVFISNDAGDTLILEAGREYKQIARISFGDGASATPAFDGRDMFLRGTKTLYCIGR
ncbi:MAG: PQQ-binding-like beta-propeller repeat protein [Planctomycetota bacterium]|nr:PQQ-binding-like beta-propeller repeat protein [Planctomycetota bacterium]